MAPPLDGATDDPFAALVPPAQSTAGDDPFADLVPQQPGPDAAAQSQVGEGPGGSIPGPIARIGSAIGNAASEVWNAPEDPETAAADARATQDLGAAAPIVHGINRAADIAARGLGAVLRGGQAGVAQTGAELGTPILGRDIAALPEAFPFGPRQITGIPRGPGGLAAITTDERGAAGATGPGPTPPPTPAPGFSLEDAGITPTVEPTPPPNPTPEPGFEDVPVEQPDGSVKVVRVQTETAPEPEEEPLPYSGDEYNPDLDGTGAQPPNAPQSAFSGGLQDLRASFPNLTDEQFNALFNQAAPEVTAQVPAGTQSWISAIARAMMGLLGGISTPAQQVAAGVPPVPIPPPVRTPGDKKNELDAILADPRPNDQVAGDLQGGATPPAPPTFGVVATPPYMQPVAPMTVEAAPAPQQIGDGTRAAPVVAQQPADVAAAAANAATPTPGQAAAGNYQMGHVVIGGLPISIETPLGQERTGVAPDGTPWSVRMPADYGYIKRTTGADGDQVDVYLGPEAHNAANMPVFVVDQIDPGSSEFDEHKAMIGFPSLAAAEHAYQAGFSDGSGAARMGAVTTMAWPQFKRWAQRGDTNKPLTYQSPQEAPLSVFKPRGKYNRPLSLAEFLAAKGGIKDHGGELAAMGITGRFVPKYGALVRPNGRDLDYARESAAEYGFLPMTSTVSDLLDLLREEAAGRPVFTPTHLAELAQEAKERADQDQADRMEDARAAVKAAVDGTPLDFTDAQLERAAVLIFEGDHPVAEALVMMALESYQPLLDELDDAFERYEIETMADALDINRKAVEVAEKRGDIDWSIPWGDEDERSVRPGQPVSENAADQGKQPAGTDAGTAGAGAAGGEQPGGAAGHAVSPGNAGSAGAGQQSEAASGPGNEAEPEPVNGHTEGGAGSAEGAVQGAAAGGSNAGKPDAETATADLAKAFSKAFLEGRSFPSIVQARIFAADVLGKPVQPGAVLAKTVDEAIEVGVILAARQIVQEGGGNEAIFDRLTRLYDQQPKLGVRTSGSVERQAYSTPAPLGFVADVLAGVGADTRVYEPTAGNGALLLAAKPKNALANELDPDRRAALALQGFNVSDRDATDPLPKAFDGYFDAVVMNPPFGAVRDDNGQTIRWDMSFIQKGYDTGEVDHAIALRALEAMKGDGRAVLILGGINKLSKTPKARADAYNGKAKREFYKVLYDNYRVTDHFTVAGELYEKQGAGWPVDVIVIEGRGKSPLPLPAVSAPRVVSTWDAVKKVMLDAKPAGTAEDGEQAASVAEVAAGGSGKAGVGSASEPAGNSGADVEGGSGSGASGQEQVSVSPDAASGVDDNAGGRPSGGNSATGVGTGRPGSVGRPPKVQQPVGSGDGNAAEQPGVAGPVHVGGIVATQPLGGASDAGSGVGDHGNDDLGLAGSSNERDEQPGIRGGSSGKGGAGTRKPRPKKPTTEAEAEADFAEKERQKDQKRRDEEDRQRRFWERIYEKMRQQRPQGDNHQAGNDDRAPKGLDEDGRWHLVEGNFVASKAETPVVFPNQKAAASWIIKTGQKDSVDQVFEIANHPTVDGAFTARETYRNPAGGAKPPEKEPSEKPAPDQKPEPEPEPEPERKKPEPTFDVREAEQFLTDQGVDLPTVATSDNAIQVARDDRGRFVVTTQGSKAQGGRYFLSQPLRSAMGQDFVKSGNRMRATIQPHQLAVVLRVINRLASDDNQQIISTHPQAKKWATENGDQRPMLGSPPSAQTQSPEGWTEAGGETDAEPTIKPAAFNVLAAQVQAMTGNRVQIDYKVGDLTWTAPDGSRHTARGLSTGGSLITVALAGPTATAWVLNHEAVHALRTFGLIRPNEWKVLERAAEKEGWSQRYGIDARYSVAQPEHAAEEAVAEGFADYMANRRPAPKGVIGAAVSRTRTFLARTRSALAGEGFTRAEDVFERMASGQMGKRPTNPTRKVLSPDDARRRFDMGADGTAPMPEGVQETLDRLVDQGDIAPGIKQDVADLIQLPMLGGFSKLPARLKEPDVVAGARTTLIERMGDFDRNVKDMLSPMVTGAQDTMAVAKKFANLSRDARHAGQREMRNLTDKFTPAQLQRMWEAADAESVALQTGNSAAGIGLDTLTVAERNAVRRAQASAIQVFEQARKVGLHDADLLPSYVPRMVVGIGGDPGEAHVVRDIRTLVLATMNLQEAVIGRRLINAIKAVGQRTGQQTVQDGGWSVSPAMNPVDGIRTKTPQLMHRENLTVEETEGAANRKSDRIRRDDQGFEWRTLLQNPAFTTWQWAGNNEDGTPKFKKVPIYIRSDFWGPLKAVLHEREHWSYRALMDLKGRMMTTILYGVSHLGVVATRAFSVRPNLYMALKEGYQAKQDRRIMSRAIQAGLVPVSSQQEFLTAEGIEKKARGEEDLPWKAQIIGFFPSLLSDVAGNKTKKAIARADRFLHDTLLWNRVGDLQAGVFVQIERDLLAKGENPLAAAATAAHLANRVTGALPREVMSQSLTRLLNLGLFSRSYTATTIGLYKDVALGLPRDMAAFITKDEKRGGAPAAKRARQLTRRLAAAAIVLDMSLALIATSAVQNAIDVMLRDKSVAGEIEGYGRRAAKVGSEIVHGQRINPMQALLDLTPMADHEPGKRNRILVGYEKDGTGIYIRFPFGKAGEDLMDYFTAPHDTLLSKLSPYARLLLAAIDNHDPGTDQHVWMPKPETLEEVVGALWDYAKYGIGATGPGTAEKAAGRIASGDGNAFDAAQIIGGGIGVSVAHGYPGGPLMGERLAIKERQQFMLERAMKDIRADIRSGDAGVAASRPKMAALGIKPKFQQQIIMSVKNPQVRPRQLMEMLKEATPTEREIVEQLVADKASKPPETTARP